VKPIWSATRYCGQAQSVDRPPAAIGATATEAVETTDNDRAAVLLGTVSL
jgi:hypothetical protein